MRRVISCWSYRSIFASLVLAVAGSAFVGACGGNPEVVRNDDGTQGPSDGGSGDSGGGNGQNGVSNFSVPGDGGNASGNNGSLPPNPCAGANCSAGQRCEPADPGFECVDQSCDELDCTASQTCEPHPEGGHVCVSIACSTDVDCTAEEFCNGTVCQADVCEPEATECNGDEVLACSSSGSGTEPKFTCESPAYFTSSCEDGGNGNAGCSCEGNWDCPANTVCEVSRCVGTGVAPTCTLPPVDFADIPPAEEIHWGGESRSDDAAHDGTPARNEAPWADYSHVVSTPIVANLDDDNGDGLINELDFPEIIFTAHQGDNPWENGVIRAIHGGGPDKGADYFARCGSELWTEGDAVPVDTDCDSPDGDAGAPVAVGDLDGDGVPEIIYMRENGTFRILDNTGAELFTLPDGWTPSHDGDTAAIANLDFEGMAEIIVGRTVYVLGRSSLGDGGSDPLTVTHILDGTAAEGRNEIARMACPADLAPSLPGLEIAAGATLYRLPDPLPSCGTPPCTGTLEIEWDATTLGDQGNDISGEGFCAVADVWGDDFGAAPGPDNPPDGRPEVILIDDGDLVILDAATGTLIEDRSLGGGGRGGAPNVDDFDGDGFMEIASALQDFYVVIDLQDASSSGDGGGACPAWPETIDRATAMDGSHNTNTPRDPGGSCTADADCSPGAVCGADGQCVCLHNGWQRDSDDSSSRATSSSVFDFNGDGRAEVLYNDECDFRVYDGRNGEVLASEMSRSRTGIENPVVADVDNDGNAEVVAVMNTAQGGRCDEDGGNPKGPNGIRVWGDPTDTWVSARRIWNQQSYHVVNVTEGGQIPLHPPESWGSFNGRTYNTYRSQPRNFGVAPDLTVADVGVSSPDAQCGVLSDNIDITFEIRNEGDLRVGPGVEVGFSGVWNGTEETLLDGSGADLTVTLQNSLEPGASVIITVNFAQENNGRDALPDTVKVVVDRQEAERECVEDNNSLDGEVTAGDERADLTVSLGAATAECPNGQVATTITNAGTAPASDVVVRYYAGDPSQGGRPIHEETIDGPIEAGGQHQLTATIDNLPKNRSIVVYAVVDPDDAVDECNDGNNKDAADNALRCGGGVIE